MDKTLRLVSLISASKVGDILRPETQNAAILENNTLDQALKIMVETDLILLPVVDDSQRVIGRLRLSELLHLALD
jgi:CBS domain-containing protein